MILFFCPECREELEGEESIRGMKMKCPACHKEIEVPQAGVKATARSRKDDKDATAPLETLKVGSKFILTVLIAGTVGLLTIMGVGYALQKRAREEAERRRPLCAACQAKGTVTCIKCNGAKGESCKECTGTGKRKNVREELEECYVCSGRGVKACLVCDGKGQYDCAGCAGKGKLDLPAEVPRR